MRTLAGLHCVSTDQLGGRKIRKLLEIAVDFTLIFSIIIVY